MSYHVKEIFYSLQGEGAQVGRPAVFCRFTGCNLWSGREADRATAVCKFCDTDFIGTDGLGGGRFETATELAARVQSFWPKPEGRSLGRPVVICTGGEPLMQLDVAAINAFHDVGFEVAIETNGTLDVPGGVDWICVSPKAGSDVVLKSGDELKIVFPQEGIDVERCLGWNFKHFFLQPMDGPDVTENTARTLDYCLEHPQWRLSLQTHKQLGVR